MKKIIVVFALLLSLSAIAQDFPYRNIELLIGKEVQIIPLNESELKYTKGYEDFSIDIKGRNIYERNGGLFVTKGEALSDRIFKVESIESNPIYDNVSMLKLKDSKGEIIYYKYKQDSLTPFKILGDIVLPEGYYCQYIEETTDKFTGEQTFKVNREYMYELTKSKKGKTVKYTLYLEYSVDKFTTGKGVIILLENNKRIEKPNLPVKMNDLKRTPHFSAIIDLTPDDIALLKENKIIDFMLFKYDCFFVPADGAIIQGALQCMLAK